MTSYAKGIVLVRGVEHLAVRIGGAVWRAEKSTSRKIGRGRLLEAGPSVARTFVDRPHLQLLILGDPLEASGWRIHPITEGE